MEQLDEGHMMAGTRIIIATTANQNGTENMFETARRQERGLEEGIYETY
jgi:hypothetical protein